MSRSYFLRVQRRVRIGYVAIGPMLGAADTRRQCRRFTTGRHKSESCLRCHPPPVRRQARIRLRHRRVISVGDNDEEVSSADRTDRSIARRQRRTRVRARGSRGWRWARLRWAARWLRRPSRLRGASIRGSPRVPRPWLHRDRAIVLLGSYGDPFWPYGSYGSYAYTPSPVIVQPPP